MLLGNWKWRAASAARAGCHISPCRVALSLKLLCLHPVSAKNPFLVLWSCSFLCLRVLPRSVPVDGSVVAHKMVWQSSRSSDLLAHLLSAEMSFY